MKDSGRACDERYCMFKIVEMMLGMDYQHQIAITLRCLIEKVCLHSMERKATIISYVLHLTEFYVLYRGCIIRKELP